MSKLIKLDMKVILAYVNVPITEILHITKTLLKQNNIDTIVPQQILLIKPCIKS